jgi:ABC-type polysaccharide/polyol phosphate export permease
MNWRKARERVAAFPLVIISSNFLQKTVFLHRHLILNFVVRDLRSRYVGSFMGVFWSLIHPLVLLISYTFVFSVIFQIRPTLKGTENFALFAFCGMLPWLYFQDTVVRSCNSIIDQSNLIRKTLFPSEILPITVALSNLVTHLIGFAILLAILLALGMVGWAACLTPVYLLLLIVLSLGLGWLVASLQVFLRDTAQVLGVIMVFWFWFTPVFYQVRSVPEAYRPWIRFNPLSHVVEGYRRLLLENQLPELSSFLVLAASALAAFLLGGFVFRNTKREFVDVL